MRYWFVLTLAFLISAACSKSSSTPKLSPGASPTAAENVQNFEGTINNKLAIRMTLRKVGKELSGTYRDANQTASWELKGTLDENNNLILNEFDGAGNQTGMFKGRVFSNSEISGTWSEPNGNNAQPFSIREVGALAAAGTPRESSDEYNEENDDTGPNPGIDLDAEARAQFQKLWHDTFTDCRNGTYVARDRNGFTRQVKNIVFIAEPRPITEADSLNNVQWKGTVRANWGVERTANSSGWGDWHTAQSHLFMYFQKRGSNWSPPNMVLWEYSRVACP